MVLVLLFYISVFIDANIAQTSYSVRLRIDTADSDITATICGLLLYAMPAKFPDQTACTSKLTVIPDKTYT